MKTTYLDEFRNFAVAYLPLGTLEWHGNYLPIETDILVAQKMCQSLADKYPGYILPPFYLGGYGSSTIDGMEMRGMDRKIGKKLPGNLYFLEPKLMAQTLSCLIENLKNQGFEKIILISGHGGSNQTAVLEELASQEGILFIDPYEPVDIGHANEGETSVLWACYPEEIGKAKSRTSEGNEDLDNYYGYDIFLKSSLEYGQQLLAIILKAAEKKIGAFLS